MPYLYRNPFTTLNELPDKPRLGIKLMLSGIGVGVLGPGWRHVAPLSFRRVSTAFVRLEPYLPIRHYRDQQFEFTDLLIATALILFICGAYIFLRKGFWWVAEHRSEDHSFTDLGLK